MPNQLVSSSCVSSDHTLKARSGDACPPEVMEGINLGPRQVLEKEPVQNGWYLQPLEDVPSEVDDVIREISPPQTYRRYVRGERIRNIRNTPRCKQNLAVSPLCDFCDDVMTNLKPTAWKETKHIELTFRGQSINQVESSAVSGSCHFCKLRWNQLSSHWRERIKGSQGTFQIKSFHHPYMFLEVRQFLDENDSFLYYIFFVRCEGNKLNFSCKTSKITCISAMSVANRFFKVQKCVAEVRVATNSRITKTDIDTFPNSCLSSSSNSSTRWALANSWIQCCERSHKNCLPTNSVARSLPTRLIDLGPRADFVQPRLCYTASLPQDTRYTTLSHCWNQETEKCKLKFHTEKAWASALPLSKLTLVFKDAMESTKRLGMQYIWIDSVCIIQDSIEDWQHESASMGDVYRNSSCNLAAASGDAGSFTDRDPIDVNMCVVKPSDTFGGRYQHYFCFARNIWQENVENVPLSKRSWVVQERILSTRILYFTQRQMFWECQEFKACESLPAGIPYQLEEKLSVTSITFKRYRQAGTLPSDKEEPYGVWERIVMHYSSTESTYPNKDRLAAISGIAKNMGMESEYLAGIWREHLVLYLGWHVPRKICEPPREYQAPSWSWASINAPIVINCVWPDRHQKVVTTLIEAYIERTGEDPTGPVQAGRIHLRGPLTLLPVPTNRFDSLRITFDMITNQERKDFHLLLIKVNRGENEYCKADGLLLEPTRVTKGEFYRRGVFRSDPISLRSRIKRATLMRMFMGSLEKLNPANYKCVSEPIDPTYPLPTYDITII